MSGGVDSLRTAALLKEQDNDVFAIHMRLFPVSGTGGWSDDSILQDRESNLETLTSKLGIPLTVVDMREVFRTRVILPFVEAYRNGLTPNPCVICNPIVKFGFLLQEAKKLDACYLATGHDARLQPPANSSGRYQLHRARDLTKDQSYFLYGLTQRQLSCALFPLGDLTKQEVMQWAQDKGYASSVPEESQELCFIPSGKYQEFLSQGFAANFSQTSGPIVDVEGNYLAEHKGIFAYTVGQRRGLGIASKAPYYVINLEPSTNTVHVGRAQHLYRPECRVEKVNWVSIDSPHKALRAQVRIRNQHRPCPGWVVPIEGTTDVVVRFDDPQRAVTPGQAAVFYNDDVVLGGGTIVKEDRI